MLNSKRNVMHSINMNREELLAIVRENKEKHITDYNESVEDYKNAVVKIAELNVKIANSGNINEMTFKSFPIAPNSYVNEYVKAIRMLELSVDDVIEVEEDVFNQLVLDEWAWKKSFMLSASTYKGF